MLQGQLIQLFSPYKGYKSCVSRALSLIFYL